MKVLILGSTGFIGRRLADAMPATTEVVTADIVADTRVGHLVFDRDRPDFSMALNVVRPDVVVNCTGAANVGASLTDPAHDFELNVVRIQQLLDAIRRSGSATRLVHLSSAAVYGNPERLPVAETAAVMPLSPYGSHKLQAEMLCREYCTIFGVRTLSLRVFSAYGPELRKQLFWDVFRKSRAAQRIELSGTGQETRDFIYVRDIAQAISLILPRDELFDGGQINIANGRGVTVEEAVRTLLGHLQWQGELTFSGKSRPGDPNFWQADITRLLSLGYRPQYELDAGLRQVAAWLRGL